MNQTPNLLVDAGSIIVPLLLVGAIIKHAIPKLHNRFIPAITLVLGTGAYVVKTGDTSMNGWVAGILASASAVGIHSGVKNFTENKKVSGRVGLLIGALLLAPLSFTGCTAPLTKGFVRTTVSTGVAVQVLHQPDTIPYLRAAAPVVCAAAHGTNISPAEIVQALESSDASKLETPEAKIIINGALSIFMTAYDEYGDDILRKPMIVAILEGTCEGILLGLPPESPEPKAIAKEFKTRVEAKPHVR